MLSKTNRFHGHGSVRRVYRVGKPARTGIASMHVSHGDKVKATKIAVVVSRKVHKSAVVRNRIRRRIYEYMRLHLDNIKQPSEIIITVYQPEIALMPADKLAANLDELCKKAKL